MWYGEPSVVDGDHNLWYGGAICGRWRPQSVVWQSNLWSTDSKLWSTDSKLWSTDSKLWSTDSKLW